MTINELIKELTRLKRDFGDLQVVIEDSPYSEKANNISQFELYVECADVIQKNKKYKIVGDDPIYEVYDERVVWIALKLP